MPARPLLRWAGSKRSALKHLELDAPTQFNTYFEPFVGSAALFYSLQPRQSVLSDLNSDLINFYQQLRSRPKQLYQRVTAIARDKETYLAVRKQFISEPDTFRRAVQFLYLNRNCFNGLYRTNKKGEFNVPFASAGQSAYPSWEDFKIAAELITSSELVRGDFHDVVGSRVKRDDFVYMDPPYLKSEGRIFSEYVKGHFRLSDLDRLDDLLQEIDMVGAKFIVSFIDDEVIEPIRQKWHSKTYSVQRNIAGFASNRRRSPELLIKNW
ncbi:DNA adenine methylase [Pseudophaeobacter arcticus]|uniref:DNA adenine methylase n=1 Tax=Pseudophaeobacter arcticus TaxID=385492 RepID=UPI003A98228A